MVILRKIFTELQSIKEELHDLRKSMESEKVSGSKPFQEVIKQAVISQKTTGKNPFTLD